jgi:hypothetical protein
MNRTLIIAFLQLPEFHVGFPGPSQLAKRPSSDQQSIFADVGNTGDPSDDLFRRTVFQRPTSNNLEGAART